MIKYKYCKEVFSEVPREISLGISITGCTIRCKGCHSRELWEDTGTPLTIEELQLLLDNHKGITCLLLLGGEHSIDELIPLFEYAHQRVKTAWYCGLDMLPKDKKEIIDHLDYLKIGHYDQELGGLDSPTTNQRMFFLDHNLDGSYWQIDITSKFQNK